MEQQLTKYKQGDVNSEGMVFLQYKLRRNGKVAEYWVTPEQFEKSKAIMLAACRKWAENNKERERLRSAGRLKANPEMNARYKVLSMAKQRAKAANVPFDLGIDDIVIPERCPVSGVVLSRGVGKLHDSSPTMDRIVPKLGYVRGNIVFVSMRINRLKSDATLDEIRAMAKFYCRL